MLKLSPFLTYLQDIEFENQISFLKVLVIRAPKDPQNLKITTIFETFYTKHYCDNEFQMTLVFRESILFKFLKKLTNFPKLLYQNLPQF